MSPSSIAQILNAAVAHHQAGRPFEAAEGYGKVLEQDPANADALYLLGLVYWDQKRLDMAETLITKSLAIRPDVPAVMDSLGSVISMQGRLDEAEPILRHALELGPDLDSTWMNLGALLLRKYENEEAETALIKAITLNPDNPDAHANLGAMYQNQDKFDLALEHYERSLALRPGWGDTLLNFANLKKELGYPHESLALYRQACAALPNSQMARKGLLSLLCYVPNLTPEEFFAEHKAFAEWLPQPPEPLPPYLNDRSPDRKLKIGYISSDLRNHPVARNFTPLFKNHDRAVVEIYCYSNSTHSDQTTETFKAGADYWRDVSHLRDDQLAEVIREDDIDIAIVQAGHFDNNRIALPAFNPAPISISLHDVATSGLEETDYLISDITLSPRDTPERFTERVLHLPSIYLHEPMEDAPDPGPPPSKQSGHITFGAFNNTSKLNDDVLSLWARVLKAVPGSTLIFKYRDVYSSSHVCTRIIGMMEKHGVSTDRLEFQTGWDGHMDHLQRLATVDIALDTFPFSGSTTTFECFSMGVPVVTLPGPRMVSRWTASMSKPLGLGDLIAKTEDDFVRIASNLAADADHLAALRQDIPARFAASPLCDGALRARQFERLYRAVWRKWLKSTDHSEGE